MFFHQFPYFTNTNEIRLLKLRCQRPEPNQDTKSVPTINQQILKLKWVENSLKLTINSIPQSLCTLKASQPTESRFFSIEKPSKVFPSSPCTPPVLAEISQVLFIFGRHRSRLAEKRFLLFTKKWVQAPEIKTKREMLTDKTMGNFYVFLYFIMNIIWITNLCV